MYDCLEYEGLELREEGIFDILTANVKKQYPDLENKLKDIYLDKWYYSHLASLRGMSRPKPVKPRKAASCCGPCLRKSNRMKTNNLLMGAGIGLP